MENNWLVYTDPYAESRKRARKKGDSFRVKYCEGCKKPWENVYNINGRDTEIKHYADFPSYGLARAECPACEGER